MDRDEMIAVMRTKLQWRTVNIGHEYEVAEVSDGELRDMAEAILERWAIPALESKPEPGRVPLAAEVWLASAIASAILHRDWTVQPMMMKNPHMDQALEPGNILEVTTPLGGFHVLVRRYSE